MNSSTVQRRLSGPLFCVKLCIAEYKKKKKKKKKKDTSAG